MEIIRELCSFEGRLAGTDAERRAANRLAERLRDLGRKAEAEPIYLHPQSALIHAAHCLFGFAGSLVAITTPALGFGLVLAAATSMYLDLNGRLYLLRRLFFRRASQNVVSPGGNPKAPARLLICAHLDTARTGSAFSPARARRFAGLAQRSPVPLGPYRILFCSLAVLIPLLGLRMAGVDSQLLSVLQLFPTLVLLVGMFGLVDIALGDVVPGANDNASGVATAISLAGELAGDAPANLDVWVVLDGGGESLQEGVRSFVRSRRKEFEKPNTFVLAIDSVGRGDVRFQTSAGWVVSYGMDRRLVGLCEAIAEADAEGEQRYGAAGYASGLGGEAATTAAAGWRSIGITCLDADGYVANRHLPSDTPKAVNRAALDRAHDFALELIRQLDADLGRKSPKR
jgi:acetylornithine deacetylase/succinyl-diaminopimelate desuccinylase-like protein